MPLFEAIIIYIGHMQTVGEEQRNGKGSIWRDVNVQPIGTDVAATAYYFS